MAYNFLAYDEQQLYLLPASIVEWVKAPVKTGMEEVVKVHHVVRRSEPLRTRVMRRLPV